MNLFIDTTNWNLIYLLEQDGKIIDSFIRPDTKKISEIAIDDLREFLNKNSLTIKEILNIYVTTGPGSYTGVRIGLGIAKTLKTLNSNYDVFIMNSLKFQAGMGKTISMFDARGNKNYIGIYKDGISQVEEYVIPLDEIEDLKNEYSNYKIVKDYEEIDFEDNFLITKDMFEKIEDVNDLLPLYVKSFI
ncbi:tRNA (adenosine(37)-N6)-threonylcarbamoyltransferase complex dimerization subunit type 1 TsaB [[Acholeplasma] multilocale]|uniref:tRNA (adenosine(37)-N6)-threonylcarbamoyltransferase complex dimerization subunit type 1 TsaB n=1 Tax=[Acholeplasma] multilocale TaxID=264638 RepID=UPI0003FB0C01|nr:tRNA (adenosine(37)-N6)-threonylcarbamoyltransferase complex dimerization subunit type 1 TsaB [[Acholeplasma] multilocale]